MTPGPLSLVPPRTTAAQITQAAKAALSDVVDAREAFERRLGREILVAERFRAPCVRFR